MKRILVIGFLICGIFSGAAFGQSISKTKFYRKHPSFGYIVLTFGEEYRKMSYSEKHNSKKVNSLVKKWMKSYANDCCGRISKEEEEFMYQELMGETEEGQARRKQLEANAAKEQAVARQKKLQEAKQSLINQVKYEWAYFNDRMIVDVFKGKFLQMDCVIVYEGNDRSDITIVYVLPPANGNRETNPATVPPILKTINEHPDRHYYKHTMEIQEDNNILIGDTNKDTFTALVTMLNSSSNKTAIKHFQPLYMGVGTIDSNGFQPYNPNK